jgi:hypothetical protein
VSRRFGVRSSHGAADAPGGAEIRRIAPVEIATGNVSVAFAALSYAGTLTISVIVDPDLAPELNDVAQALRRELDELAQGSSSR